MLSTEQVKVMFVGTLPPFYTPDQQQRADDFEQWLADHDRKIANRSGVLLIGGPFDRITVHLRKEPRRILIAGRIYERIDDPDTGEGLGAYARA